MAKASRAAPETASEDVRRRMRSGLGPERSRPGYLAKGAILDPFGWTLHKSCHLIFTLSVGRDKTLLH